MNFKFEKKKKFWIIWKKLNLISIDLYETLNINLKIIKICWNNERKLNVLEITCCYYSDWSLIGADVVTFSSTCLDLYLSRAVAHSSKEKCLKMIRVKWIQASRRINGWLVESDLIAIETW